LFDFTGIYYGLSFEVSVIISWFKMFSFGPAPHKESLYKRKTVKAKWGWIKTDSRSIRGNSFGRKWLLHFV